MPGSNTTGLPNTDDYNLGRGIVYFSRLDALGVPLDFRDLGNAPEFSISVESETLEHQSSRQGLKVTDKEVLISQKISVALTLDEINFENLAAFLSGSVAANQTNPAIAGSGGAVEVCSVSEGLVLGRWYDLKDSGLNRIYDIESAGTVTPVDGTTTTGLVLNDDFILDQEMGRIFITTDGTKSAGMAGEGLSVTVTANAGAENFDEVRALTQSAVTGALKFIAENPAANDKQTEFQFHQVSLKAEGDFSLIGDEFTQMQFTAVAEANVAAGGASSPTLTIRTLVAE